MKELNVGTVSMDPAGNTRCPLEKFQISKALNTLVKVNEMGFSFHLPLYSLWVTSKSHLFLVKFQPPEC